MLHWVSLLVISLATPPGLAGTLPSTLILIGGGQRPIAALQAGVGDAASPRLGVVAWASGEEAETVRRFREELAKLTPTPLEVAPSLPKNSGSFSPSELRALLIWIRTLDAIYFTGGDQNRILDLFRQHPEIPRTLQERYQAGLLRIAGTSAGTAIQGERVFTGDEDLTEINSGLQNLRPGLGALPGFIVDQHFLKRQRHNRLISALISFPGLLGLAIDEDTALVIEHTRTGWRGMTFGRGNNLVLIPQAAQRLGAQSFEMHLQAPGSCFSWSQARQGISTCR
jgi:cyanophycinase